MSDYARIKGGASASESVAVQRAARPSRQLSDAERERVAANRAFVHEHMPELVDFIKELHAEGLIDGWRAVENCATTNEP